MYMISLVYDCAQMHGNSAKTDS